MNPTNKLLVKINQSEGNNSEDWYKLLDCLKNNKNE